MKKWILLIFVLCITVSAKIAIVNLDGTVDNGMAYLLNRALTDVEKGDTLVIKVNTYGGLLFNAFDMADSIFNSEAYTIAFVEQKAISAGALISIACNEIIMQDGSTIGDCAPITQGEDGPKILNEKIQSPLRAKFRLFAKKNGYPEDLAAAMVSPRMRIYKIASRGTAYYTDLKHSTIPRGFRGDTTIVVDSGELLTLTASEAIETGFSTRIVSNFDELKSTLGINETSTIFSRTWSEKFVAFIGSIAPFLMMIGMAGLYIESKTPGIGAPGIIGAVALLLAYSGQHLAGLAGNEEFLLLAIGVVLLIAEVFILPGFGVAGVLGIGFIAISAVLSLQNFTLPSPNMPFQMDIFIHNILVMSFSLFGAILIVLFFFWKILPKLNKVIAGPILTSELPHSISKKEMVGKKGIAYKDLHPSGKVKIEGDVYEAITEGLLIEKGTHIVVADEKGSTLIVEEVE